MTQKVGGPMWRVGAVGGGALAFMIFRELGSADSVIRSLELGTAWVAAALIRAVGIDVARHATILVHPSGFGYEIYHACTALVPSTILVSVLLFSRSPLSVRARAIAIGLPLVVLLNFARLVTLFVLGVHFPRAFPLFHEVVWQVVFVVFILGYCLCWAGKGSAGTEPAPQHMASSGSRL